MKHLRFFTLIFLFISLCIWFGCSDKHEETKSKPTIEKKMSTTVYVTNYPLMYFADRIAMGKVDIVFPAPADEDPAFWIPDAKTIKGFQSADLILVNGATYEKWLEKVTLPESKIVDTSISFKERFLELKHAVTHSHGPGGEHAHTGTDFNTWVDPNLAVIQAEAVKNALLKLKPLEAETFEDGYNRLKADLQKLDMTFRSIVKEKESTPLVASHPVYGYFAKAYGLDIVAMLWEPEVVASDEEWKHLDEILKAHKAKWMIWEGAPSEENVAKAKDHGLDGIVFAPCGNVPDEGDYMEVMKHNSRELRKIFKD